MTLTSNAESQAPSFAKNMEMAFLFPFVLVMVIMR
jgi:hypothetical protein